MSYYQRFDFCVYFKVFFTVKVFFIVIVYYRYLNIANLLL